MGLTSFENIRVNMGCGQTLTNGWLNCDNSFAIFLAKWPKWFVTVILKLGILSDKNFKYIKFAREQKIKYLDASKKLPFSSDSIEVIYSSHMLEHLHPNQASRFISECYRCLIPGGCLRLVLPDLDKLVEQYSVDQDARKFMQESHLGSPSIESLKDRLRIILFVFRHHQWMYNASSLIAELQKHGFSECIVTDFGATRIPQSGSLDLYERAESSFCVEVIK